MGPLVTSLAHLFHVAPGSRGATSWQLVGPHGSSNDVLEMPKRLHLDSQALSLGVPVGTSNLATCI